jgi:diphthine synthase
MTLNIIGIGLNDEKDITVKGLEAVKNSDFIYLETYTSKLQCSFEKLEKLYGKKIILADRELVEKKAEEILDKAKDKQVSFLVIGDALSATTHTDLMLRAKEQKIKVNIIHNASIITAVGITGLEIYKFGKITSIPFENENIKAPYEVLKKNQNAELHTLFLLDLHPDNNNFLTIPDAVNYLIKQGMKEYQMCVGCARLGSNNPTIIYAKASELIKKDFGKAPYCLIVPSKLHFMEEDVLEQYKK